jgi:hypothetical protein
MSHDPAALAVGRDRGAGGPHQLGMAFTGGDEERRRGDDEHEPARQGDGRGRSAGQRAQHKAAGHHDDVHHRDVAPQHCVADRQGEVADANQAELQPDREAECEADDQPNDTERERLAARQLAGRDGPEALAGMAPVLGGVTDIVERVDAGGEQTEGDEGQRDPDRHALAAEGPGGARGRDHQRVLDPLSRACGDEDRVQAAARAARPAAHGFGRRRRLSTVCGSGGGHHTTGCRPRHCRASSRRRHRIQPMRAVSTEHVSLMRELSDGLKPMICMGLARS